MQFAALIPARLGSTRFPNKPLALLLGEPMVLHVVDRCAESKAFDQILVATDDERIARVVRDAGVEVQLTSRDCASGTDRVAEAARKITADVILNVQGDEPALHPQALWSLARAFEDPAVQMATLVRPLREEERGNRNVVKAVLAEDGHALYFTRASVPFAHAHVGIYGYRAATLQQLAALAPTELERAENLEQLRALGHGVRIFCVHTEHESHAVDVPADVPLAEAALQALPRSYPP